MKLEPYTTIDPDYIKQVIEEKKKIDEAATKREAELLVKSINPDHHYLGVVTKDKHHLHYGQFCLAMDRMKEQYRYMLESQSEGSDFGVGEHMSYFKHEANHFKALIKSYWGFDL